MSKAQIPKDKELHLGAGVVIGAWGTLIPQDKDGIKPLLYGVGCATIAGAGKEIIDLGGYGTPEIKDFAFTVAGGIIGAGIVQGGKYMVKVLKKHHRYSYKYNYSNSYHK